jgi:hypothetical protein
LGNRIKDFAVFDGSSLVLDDQIAFKVFLSYFSVNELNPKLFDEYRIVMEKIEYYLLANYLIEEIRNAAFSALLTEPGTQLKEMAISIFKSIFSLKNLSKNLFKTSLIFRDIELQNQFTLGREFAETIGKDSRNNYLDASKATWYELYLFEDGNLFADLYDNYIHEVGDWDKQLASLFQLGTDNLLENFMEKSPAELSNSFIVADLFFSSINFIDNIYKTDASGLKYIEEIEKSRVVIKSKLYNKLQYSTLATSIAESFYINYKTPSYFINTKPSIWFFKNPLIDIDFAAMQGLNEISYQIDSNNDSSASSWHLLTSDGISTLPGSQNNPGNSLTSNWKISDADWNNLTANVKNEGQHFIYFKVSDDAGNIFITPDQASAFEFGKDVNIPNISFNSPMEGQFFPTSTIKATWSVDDVSAGLSLSGVDSIYIAIDQTVNFIKLNNIAREYTFNDLQNSTHTIYLKAKDKAGNFSSIKNVRFSTFDCNLSPGVKPQISIKLGAILVCSNVQELFSKYQWYKGSNLINNATGQFYDTKKQQDIYFIEITDKNGCKNVSNTISISGSKSLSIHPNPASSAFELKIQDSSLSSLSNGNTTVCLFNDTGLKVMEFQTEKDNDQIFKTISVDNLKDGVYILNVTVGSEDIYTAKVVVKK